MKALQEVKEFQRRERAKRKAGQQGRNALAAQAPALLNIAKQIEKKFGKAIDKDREINGGDAVDFICQLIRDDIRPTLAAIKGAQS